MRGERSLCDRGGPGIETLTVSQVGQSRSMMRFFDAATLRHRRRRGAEASGLPGVLWRLGARAWQFELASLSSMIGCTSMWVSAKTVDQAQREHMERRALYVGLWTQTLYLIARSLRRDDA